MYENGWATTFRQLWSEQGFPDMVAAFGGSKSGLEVVAKANNDYLCRETNPNHSSRSKLLFSMQQQPLVDQSLFLIEVSRSHSDNLHSVGPLRTSDQADAETST
jgi:hypothetical protein